MGSKYDQKVRVCGRFRGGKWFLVFATVMKCISNITIATNRRGPPFSWSLRHRGFSLDRSVENTVFA